MDTNKCQELAKEPGISIQEHIYYFIYRSLNIFLIKDTTYEYVLVCYDQREVLKLLPASSRSKSNSVIRENDPYS